MLIENIWFIWLDMNPLLKYTISKLIEIKFVSIGSYRTFHLSDNITSGFKL